MGTDDPKHFVFYEGRDTKNVPPVLIDWFKKQIPNSVFTFDELNAFKTLFKSQKSIPFWKWATDKLGARSPEADAFDQVEAIEEQNLIEFVKAVILLKDRAKNENIRKFNLKAHTQSQIDHYEDVKRILTKAPSILRRRPKLFSIKPIRNNLSRSQQSKLLQLTDKAEQKLLGRNEIFDLTERALTESIVFQIEVLNAVIDNNISHAKWVGGTSTQPRKITHANAAAVFYCHELIFQFKTHLTQQIPYEDIAKIINLMMSPSTPITGNHLRNMVTRSIRRKK